MARARRSWPEPATRRTASTISAGGVSLRTNPAAAARRARSPRRRWARARAAHWPARPARPARRAPARPLGRARDPRQELAWPRRRRCGPRRSGRCRVTRTGGRGPRCRGRACEHWSGLPGRPGRRCGRSGRGRGRWSCRAGSPASRPGPTRRRAAGRRRGSAGAAPRPGPSPTRAGQARSARPRPRPEWPRSGRRRRTPMTSRRSWSAWWVLSRITLAARVTSSAGASGRNSSALAWTLSSDRRWPRTSCISRAISSRARCWACSARSWASVSARLARSRRDSTSWRRKWMNRPQPTAAL